MGFTRVDEGRRSFALSFAISLHRVFLVDFHMISTFWAIWVNLGAKIVELAIDFLLDFVKLFTEEEIEFEVVIDFFDAMHNGGVIFDADLGGDFVGAEVEFFTEEVHGDLAGVFDVSDAGFSAHFFDGEFVVFGDFFDDLFGGDGAHFVVFIDGDGTVINELEGSEAANLGHEENGREFTFEIANVGVDVFGDVFDGFGFDFGTEKFGFGAENGAFVFEFGELEVEGAGPSEARGETFVDGFDLGGEAVASDDDLFVELIEVIEDVEEFLLGFLFVDDELEIIDDENIEFAEFEIKFFTFAKTDGIDEIGVEMRNRGVKNFEGGILFEKFVADGLDKVGFTEAGSAIEEEGVVAAAGSIDDATGGRNSKIVVGTDDEIIESVFFVETRSVGGFFEIFLGGFDVMMEGRVIIFSDFARTDTGFGVGFDFEIDGNYRDVVVFESGFDEIKITNAELVDEKRIFDTDANSAFVGREEGSILEPSNVITVANSLLNLS